MGHEYSKYTYKVRRITDGKYWHTPTNSEIDRQMRRGREIDYWKSEKYADKFQSIEDAVNSINAKKLTESFDVEIVPFEVVIVTTVHECVPIQLNEIDQL